MFINIEKEDVMFPNFSKVFIKKKLRAFWISVLIPNFLTCFVLGMISVIDAMVGPTRYPYREHTVCSYCCLLLSIGSFVLFHRFREVRPSIGSIFLFRYYMQKFCSYVAKDREQARAIFISES